MCLFQCRLHIASFVRNFLFVWEVSSFGMGSVAYCEKLSFGLFQRVNLVLMSPPSYVDMFYAHSQRFMHCQTSVVTFVAKCISCHTWRGMLYHCCIEGKILFFYYEWSMFSHKLLLVCDLYLVFSLFTWASLIPHLAISRKFHFRAT